MSDTLGMNVPLEVQGVVKMCIPETDSVQMCAKIDQIPSNPEIRVQFTGCFCRHFLLHAYQQKAQPALLSL